MLEFANKHVLVIGLDSHGCAAAELLHRCGARVMAVDPADTPVVREAAQPLRVRGARVEFGVSQPPEGEFSLAVLCPAVLVGSPLVQGLVRRGIPLMSELELGLRSASCLGIAVAGTNGKGTTTGLIERMLTNNHRPTILCGHSTLPVCSAVDLSKDLDFLIFQIHSFQLQTAEFFRPAVAVLLNLAPDHLDRFASTDEYVRPNSRLFRNQQVFDWAIVQSEALGCLRELGLPVHAKTITFSASDPNADLFLDRGLIVSRLTNWLGPLLDLDHCQLRGPHNAENLMAALAVGHVLHLPMESMVDALKTYFAGPHRYQLVAEINGVQFINDSKATNVDALQKAVLASRPGRTGEPNIWLIAGGTDNGLDFHQAGPLISKRVKRAFLLGRTGEKIRSAWSLFTPCKLVGSLLEAVAEAASNATSGDVVLLSPACSGFDLFRNYQHRGQVFCEAVKSISRGDLAANPNMHGSPVPVC